MMRTWGVWVLVVAGVLWVAFAWRLLGPHPSALEHCDAPFTWEYSPDNTVSQECFEARRPATTALLLVFALPLSVLGTMLATFGHVRHLLSTREAPDEQREEEQG
ncbi:hypothetical protein G5C51_33310 [Streptomyces sp. A7024]|uniref:Uncharacterized protein n=1 Tax=Streptomyces coryli TaxID=1128680 RepID=A0A6G4UBQ1_9ACTN|nr:hypothetical protein [Streptomyces coryli]NGN68757.1 hypothetical protein [Streptomyces coryli]